MRHWLRAVFVFAASWPLPPRSAPEWEPEDIASLSRYLQTPTGRKLFELVRYQEASLNASAVLKTGTTDYACGFAAGNRACIATLWSLSADARPQESEAVDPLGELTGPELIENLRS